MNFQQSFNRVLGCFLTYQVLIGCVHGRVQLCFPVNLTEACRGHLRGNWRQQHEIHLHCISTALAASPLVSCACPRRRPAGRRGAGRAQRRRVLYGHTVRPFLVA